MQINRSVKIYILVCMVIMCTVSGFTLLVNKDMGRTETKEAHQIEELRVFIDFPEDTIQIKGWENEEGTYVFFLPSGSEKYPIYFGNLGESNLKINKKDIFTNTCLLNELTEEEICFAELTTEAGYSTRNFMFLISDGVPSLFLETETASMDKVHEDKEYKEKGKIQLLSADGKEEYANAIEYVKARGNSTFYSAEKKSYQFKLHKDTEILGMPSAKKWILLANEIDYTLIKNELIFRYTETYSSVPSIRGEYVDLYLNNEYAGNYYLCEKVEVGENRLNIVDIDKATRSVNYERDYASAEQYISADGNIKATEGLKNPEDITGGYLLEHILASEYEMESNAFRTNTGHCYAIRSPEIATKEQVEYICRFVNEMEAAIMSENGINPETGKHYSEYLDVDSWTTKYVIEEAFSDPDAAVASAFFYKDSDYVNTRIFAGPMWDYDRAMGSYGYEENFILDDSKRGGYSTGIYAQELMMHEEIRDIVQGKLEEELVPYAENLIQAEIYRLEQKIGRSAELNRIRWKKIGGYYTDYTAAMDYLSVFLKERVQYLYDIWSEREQYCSVRFLDYYGNEKYVYHVKRGEYLAIYPTLASYVAIFNGWESVENGLPFDNRLPILQDITYQSKWIDMGIILANGLATLQSSTEEYDDISEWTEIPPEIFENIADMLREKISSEADE